MKTINYIIATIGVWFIQYALRTFPGLSPTRRAEMEEIVRQYKAKREARGK